MTFDRLEHLRYLHALAERYKDSVYMRAYVLLTASAVEVAVLSGIVAFVSNSNGLWKREFFAAAAITLALQFGAAAMALSAVAPWRRFAVADLVHRHRKRKASGGMPSHPKFSSFNRVCEFELSQFLALFEAATEESLYYDLAVTYYNLCVVVSTRYLDLRRAYHYQLVSLVLFCIVACMVPVLS
ncbi:MAG: hypothetical protein QOC81_3552 [Thermoanaerobaculia bacterium]|jgi:hypothetical protein|nr:hypothetical protein [Thermoanaerobaculia bacterium]